MNKQRLALPLLTLFVIVAALFATPAANALNAATASLPFTNHFVVAANTTAVPSNDSRTVTKEVVVPISCTTPGAVVATPIGQPFPTLPEPTNQGEKFCGEGKISISVGSQQWFANHIGGIVDVRISLLAPNSVTVDFRSLEQGTLKFDGTSTFHLARDNPVRIQKEGRDGDTLYTIDLRVQTFVPKQSVRFDLDLRYAFTFIPGTKTPDWKVLTTPSYTVTTSNTGDGGKVLLQGNMQPVPIAPPISAQLLIGAGSILFSIWPLWSLLRWLNRKRPGYTPSASEAAWTAFRQVIREGNRGGFEERHFGQLSASLKGYLGVGTRTRQEISELLKDSPAISTILSALQKCDRALYAGADHLAKDDLTELLAQLEEIVPKPD